MGPGFESLRMYKKFTVETPYYDVSTMFFVILHRLFNSKLFDYETIAIYIIYYLGYFYNKMHI